MVSMSVDPLINLEGGNVRKKRSLPLSLEIDGLVLISHFLAVVKFYAIFFRKKAVLLLFE